MRTTAFFIILFLSFGFVVAQNVPEDYTKAFFELVGQKKYSEAINKLPANKILKDDTTYNTKLLAKLNSIGLKGGEYCGYELVEKEEISPSYVNLTYFIKYLYSPQKIQFTFYKPKDSWQLIQLNLNVPSRPSASGRKQSFPTK